jgi:hypothetical protein
MESKTGATVSVCREGEGFCFTLQQISEIPQKIGLAHFWIEARQTPSQTGHAVLALFLSVSEHPAEQRKALSKEYGCPFQVLLLGHEIL